MRQKKLLREPKRLLLVTGVGIQSYFAVEDTGLLPDASVTNDHQATRSRWTVSQSLLDVATLQC